MKILEKVERRLGEKLFLKGDRCAGSKCAFVRRSYPPGIHGRKRGRRRTISEFGFLLKEKQKIRFLYGLDNRVVERYARKASSRSGKFAEYFLQLLECRLDNTVFLLGFGQSRRVARVLVSHGHILVNGKKMTIPSYSVRKNDVIAIRERSLASPLFFDLDARLKKHEPPLWMTLDKNKRAGTVGEYPRGLDQNITFDLIKIKEFYLR